LISLCQGESPYKAGTYIVFKKGGQVNNFPPLSYLTKDQAKQLHEAALKILSNTGIHLPHTEARELLKSAGAKEDEDGRILLSRAMVEDAISKAPSNVPVYDQTGKKALDLAINNTYFGPGSDSLYVRDYDTGEMRRAILQDVIDNVRIVEQLSSFDFVMSMGLPQDVEASKLYASVFREMLIHSTKPIVATSTCLLDLEIPHQMASLVAGGEDAFKAKPFFIAYIEPESPLKFEENIVDRIWFCGEKGIPTMAVAASNLGGGGPITMEGAMAQGIAESLAGLVLLQMKHAGAGFVFGSNTWGTDMRTAIVSYGSPECATSSAAYADMGRFYNLPSWAGAGCTDAHTVDAQAGEEAFQSILFALQAGVTLAHDVGFLAYGSLYDARFLILANEMIDRARHMWHPLNVNEENLALSVVDDVARASIKGEGPTIYLTHPHTARNFRHSVYVPPTFIDRKTINFGQREDTLLERLTREAKKLLASDPQPTIPGALVEKLRSF
jgi:trimethylamine--corrinoid protein Co-methyltransferase